MYIKSINNTTFNARIKLAPPTKESLIKTGLISAGLGVSVLSNVASTGFYSDQSVHENPMLFSRFLPESYLDVARESFLQKSAFKILYNPLGIGNETAALPGSICSTIGNSSAYSALKSNK